MLEPSNPASPPAELFRQLASTAQQIELQWSPARAQGILRGVEQQRRLAQRRRAMVPMLCAASLAIVLVSFASWAAFRQRSPSWSWPWSVKSTVIPQMTVERTTLHGHRSASVTGTTPPTPPAPPIVAPIEATPEPIALPPPPVAPAAPALEDHPDAATQPAMHGVAKSLRAKAVADHLHAAAVTRTPTAAAEEKPTWQQLAHEGQFEQAYTLAYGPPDTTKNQPPAATAVPATGPGELLLLADVARLSHHPADAVMPLNKLLSNHAADPRAPLAAFTLGRVLLDDLGRPREAADAFRKVQTLEQQGPDGPLAQDALAREVEAWSRAGEPQRAKERAGEYVRHYPTGRRLRSVRHYGELD